MMRKRLQIQNSLPIANEKGRKSYWKQSNRAFEMRSFSHFLYPILFFIFSFLGHQNHLQNKAE